MNHMLTDEELIDRYLPTQPTHCYNLLYQRYAHKLYCHCLQLTQNPEQAKDYAHDVFLKVFDKLGSFQQRARFSSWLHAITFNYCMDQNRRTRRLAYVGWDTQIDTSMADTLEAKVLEEAIQQLGSAMASLSPHEQTLLKLKYEQGLSIRELSGMYDQSMAVIKMRLKRSRAKVHRYYARQADRQ